MVINMNNGLQQAFAQQMRKHLNPVMPNPIKQIVENRIESHKESGRFDTVKFSKMLNTPVENKEDHLTFEEKLQLKSAFGRMKSGIKDALASAKAAPKIMELAKEGEAYYKDLLSRFDENKDYLIIDDKELAFGLKDEMSTSTKNSNSHIIELSNLNSTDLDKSLVKRSTVEKALENVRKSISSLVEDGIDSPHTFTDKGYAYSDTRSMSSRSFKSGVFNFGEVLPGLADKFESFFKKGSELCEESGYGEEFEAGTASRISALEEFLNDLEFVEEDFSAHYRLTEEEENTGNPEKIQKNAKFLEIVLKKYEGMYNNGLIA